MKVNGGGVLYIPASCYQSPQESAVVPRVELRTCRSVQGYAAIGYLVCERACVLNKLLQLSAVPFSTGLQLLPRGWVDKGFR